MDRAYCIPIFAQDNTFHFLVKDLLYVDEAEESLIQMITKYKWSHILI